jgi:hypothetical protein
MREGYVHCTGNTGAIAGANQRRHHTRQSHGTACVWALIHAKVIHLACIAYKRLSIGEERKDRLSMLKNLFSDL